MVIVDALNLRLVLNIVCVWVGVCPTFHSVAGPLPHSELLLSLCCQEQCSYSKWVISCYPIDMSTCHLILKNDCTAGTNVCTHALTHDVCTHALTHNVSTHALSYNYAHMHLCINLFKYSLHTTGTWDLS